jgi:subtilisin
MPDTLSDLQQFVLLPPRGMQADSPSTGRALVNFFSSLRPSVKSEISESFTVLDTIHETGAKLVEMTSEDAFNLRGQQPGVRIVPVVYFHTAVAPRHTPDLVSTAATTLATKFTIQILSKSGEPISDADVIAFTDFNRRVGAQGKTDSKGSVSLTLSTASIDRLYIYPRLNHWGKLKKQFTLASSNIFKLTPIDFSFVDVLRFFYKHIADNSGVGVKVGVIDTGIAAHPDLVIDGGINTVRDESPSDFGDNGEGHGTHVAGIIAARGLPPTGVRGVAPGVVLRSYRVFGKDSPNASNFAIAKAIDQAVADGCDLINMSLGGGPADEVTQDAIASARSKGTVVIVATGNDDRSPVSFPASDPLSLAVSAMGRKGTFPPETLEPDDVGAPFGKDKKNFIATFSNIGPEVDLTGPGVGIISTIPGGYAVLDGTSMACPAATGAAARLLSAHPEILSMPRDQSRSDAIARLVLQTAKPLGFGETFEGHGLIG